MGNHLSNMASSPSLRPSLSTDSDYDGGCCSSHTDSRVSTPPCVDDKIADRRKRNGESAKRSRQKRKLKLAEMESSYQSLVAGQAQLMGENEQLRKLIATLGGDPSAIPASLSTPVVPIPESQSTSKPAKRVKRECRADLKANSLESEATRANSLQLEPTPHQLALATTALLLTLLSTTSSTIRANPKLQDAQITTSTSPGSILTTSSNCASNSQTRNHPQGALTTVPSSTTVPSLTSISPNSCLTRHRMEHGGLLTVDSTNVLMSQLQPPLTTILQ